MSEIIVRPCVVGSVVLHGLSGVDGLTIIYDAVLTSRARDLRHLKALAWMVSALICSGQLSLPAWEPYVPSRATKAQSVERRWQRFLVNGRIRVSALYVPLVLAALTGWHGQQLYLVLDTESAVGSILYDTSVSGVQWTSRSLVVAGVGAWQCHSGI